MNFTVVPGLWSGDKPQARITHGLGTVGRLRRHHAPRVFSAELEKPSQRAREPAHGDRLDKATWARWSAMRGA